MSEHSAIEWEAAEWVGRQMGDEPFDQAGFDAWLAGDPRRKPLFDAMWARIMGPKMDQGLGAYVRRRRARRALATGGIVAMLALFASYRALPAIELFFAQPQEFAATEGAIREIRLDDGTRLTLAGGTQIRIRYGAHVREVELTRGTIFADVVHDATRPFRIDAGQARIADIGTRFEVSSKPDFVRVAVEEGRVRFGDDSWFGPWFDKNIDLTARQAAILTTAGLNRTDDADAIARWRSEWVEYRDTPMRQVVADLESVSPLPIRIADADLANRQVSGRIRLTDPMRQIDNLSIIHNFSVTRQGGAIVLSDNR